MGISQDGRKPSPSYITTYRGEGHRSRETCQGKATLRKDVWRKLKNFCIDKEGLRYH